MRVKFLKAWCTKATRHIVFKLYDFPVSAFGIISTTFEKFPLMQHVVRTNETHLARILGIFHRREQSPSRWRDFTSHGKIKRVPKLTI